MPNDFKNVSVSGKETQIAAPETNLGVETKMYFIFIPTTVHIRRLEVDERKTHFIRRGRAALKSCNHN
jgi:hypothetical protein